MDRRADTSDGSAGTSRTVVTSRRDDDDPKASKRPADRDRDHRREREGPTGRRGGRSCPGHARRQHPAGPDFGALHLQPVSVCPGYARSRRLEGQTIARRDGTGREPAEGEPAESEPAPAATGTGWSSDGTKSGARHSTEPSAEDTSPAPEPEPRASPRPPSPGTRPKPPPPRRRLQPRNFLRASAARGLAASRQAGRYGAGLPRQARRRPRTLSRTDLPGARPGRRT